VCPFRASAQPWRSLVLRRGELRLSCAVRTQGQGLLLRCTRRALLRESSQPPLQYRAGQPEWAPSSQIPLRTSHLEVRKLAGEGASLRSSVLSSSSQPLLLSCEESPAPSLSDFHRGKVPFFFSFLSILLVTSTLGVAGERGTALRGASAGSESGGGICVSFLVLGPPARSLIR